MSSSNASTSSLLPRVNPDHVFGIATLRDGAVLHSPSLTADMGILARELKAFVQPAPDPLPVLDLGSLAAMVKGVGPGTPPVRIILMYCRSQVGPCWISHKDAGLPVDVVYVHQKPVPGLNKVQDIYNVLEDLSDKQAQLAGHKAFIFEASAPNVKILMNLIVLLMAHPSTRPEQQHLPSSLRDLATMPLLQTAASTTMPRQVPAPPSLPLPTDSSATAMKQDLQSPSINMDGGLPALFRTSEPSRAGGGSASDAISQQQQLHHPPQHDTWVGGDITNATPPLLGEMVNIVVPQQDQGSAGGQVGAYPSRPQ